MKPKFEIGDRVCYKPSDNVGTICGVCQCTNIYTIRFDNDGEKYSALECDIEFETPKLTFLTRLQELLATFDAKIYAWGDEIYTTITLKIGDRQELYYSHGFLETHKNNLPITADNVFDYEKD